MRLSTSMEDMIAIIAISCELNNKKMMIFPSSSHDDELLKW